MKHPSPSLVIGSVIGECMITEEGVLEALRKVNDPELHRDLVSLGMVKEIKVAGGP